MLCWPLLRSAAATSMQSTHQLQVELWNLNSIPTSTTKMLDPKWGYELIGILNCLSTDSKPWKSNDSKNRPPPMPPTPHLCKAKKSMVSFFLLRFFPMFSPFPFENQRLWGDNRAPLLRGIPTRLKLWLILKTKDVASRERLSWQLGSKKTEKVKKILRKCQQCRCLIL